MSSVIDEIKARIDVVDLIAETVQLRRSGRNYTGFCPFHSNTRTPAFAVFPDTGTWRCFGQCNEGGDIFGFVMKKEGVDFSEALRILAERAGVQLKPPTPQEEAAEEEHAVLRQLLEEAAGFYRHQLFHSSAGLIALTYLHKRGIRDAAIEAFELGYAPKAWDALTNHLISRKYSERDLIAAGLVSERERETASTSSSGVYDKFRNRIMFPIRDERGRIAGFGARILDPEDTPKFLNSPQTPVFDKGRLLYGLDRARKSIRAHDQAVIVEGYLDVIALHQAGYTNAVSPMGTALTEHQLSLLKRHTRRIVLALDADVAGQLATFRGLQTAQQAMDYAPEVEAIRYDPRKLKMYEDRLQADLRVTTLPPGMDPDDVVRKDPKEWEDILEKARPIVIHVMETLATGRDLEDPKVKSEIAAQVLPLIQEVPSPIERDTYRQRLARLLRVDERTLMAEPVSTRRPTGRKMRLRQASEPPKAEATLSPAASNYALEAYVLGLLLRSPDLIYRVDRELQKFNLSRLLPEDFLHADHQTILKLLQESVDQDVDEPVNYVLSHLSLPMMEVADNLLAQSEKLDPNDERVLGDLVRALLDLRTRNLSQNIEYLRYLMQDAQQQGDLRVESLQKSMAQHTIVRQRLDQARGFYTRRSQHVRG